MVYLRTVILRRRRGLRVVRGGGDGGSGGGGGGNYGRGGSGGGRRDEDREGVSALLGGLGLGLVLDASVSRREGCVMEHGGCDGGGSCEVVVVMVASGGSDGAGGAGCCVLWGGKGVMCGSISFEPPRSISGCTLQPKSWRPIRGQVPGNDGGCRRRAIDGGQRRRHSHHANQVSVDTTQKRRSMCRSRSRATDGPKSSLQSCSFGWVFLFKSSSSRHRPHREPAKGQVDHQEHDGGVRWAGDSRRSGDVQHPKNNKKARL